MPRTVCTNSGLAGSVSILRRSRLTWTSTARSPAAAAGAGQHESRHGLAGPRREQPQHVLLAVGEMDDLIAAAQFAARRCGTRTGRSAPTPAVGGGRRLRPLEDVGDAQRQFPRLERLRHIIVGADLEAGDPALRSRRARSASGSAPARCVRSDLARSKPVSPGHHHVEDQQIEATGRRAWRGRRRRCAAVVTR